MGASSSIPKTSCDPPRNQGESFVKDSQIPFEPPPAMRHPQSFEEKMYEKFTKQPLVPVGCAATVYFLVSGINSFQKRDPRRAQKMMRARVGAQFATLATFVYYVGFENVNFDIAPAYYRAKDNTQEGTQDSQGGGSP